MTCQMVETFGLACHKFLPRGGLAQSAGRSDHLSIAACHCITVNANCEDFREEEA